MNTQTRRITLLSPVVGIVAIGALGLAPVVTVGRSGISQYFRHQSLDQQRRLRRQGDDEPAAKQVAADESRRCLCVSQPQRTVGTT